MGNESDQLPFHSDVTAAVARRAGVFSLQWKATFLVAALTVFMTAAVSGYLLRCSESLAHEQQHAQVVQAAALLSKAAAVAIVNDDRVGLDNLAREAANGKPLLYVTITDGNGHVLAEARHPDGDSATSQPADAGPRRGSSRPTVPGTPMQTHADDPASALLALTYPITHRDTSDTGPAPRGVRLLGYVRTAMVTNDWERSMSSRVDLLVGVGLLVCLAALPLGFLLIHRIVAPMQGIAAAMNQFSEGKLDVRSPIDRQDEIGALARAFNQMADEHERTHTRLVRLNAELEERVAYRTRQLRELASRDPLTGLYNRRHFTEVLERRFAEAARYDTGLSCIMIDLDEFKAANDAFGHQIGDELLAMTATTIVSQLRTPDVAARYGGDEFVLLLPQTHQDRARILAERIAEKFARDVTERFPGLNVRMSAGIASLESLEQPSADALIRSADQALYLAKATGKNRIALAHAEPRSSTASSRLQGETV